MPRRSRHGSPSGSPGCPPCAAGCCGSRSTSTTRSGSRTTASTSTSTSAGRRSRHRGTRELAELTGHLAGIQLDRSRPLWELWVVEGLEQGLVAIVAKLHHAAIDGLLGLDLMANLFDLEPVPVEAGREAPRPRGPGRSRTRVPPGCSSTPPPPWPASRPGWSERCGAPPAPRSASGASSAGSR
ncbi:MAG: wax ester/triacylglycerol synthase family O-acyltransferase [Acidimicrobiia bacterium]|nr:wax ester/triacylglycerol synthase family O-acyltransferase [Acidimicrobiia bacterium]